MITSAFQFGEVRALILDSCVALSLAHLVSPSPSFCCSTSQVLLEWSKERYAVQFSIYADNIAGRSFEYQ